MHIILLSDIHSNFTALKSVLNDIDKKYSDYKVIHLGDCIDYGMRPNEVIKELIKLKDKTIINIQGNHERTLFGYQSDRFSSQRGIESNEYTKKILSHESFNYIKNEMNETYIEYKLFDKKFLVIHGDLTDNYWGKMPYNETQKDIYNQYQYVISGHTHIPHLYTKIHKESRLSTVFINPGSVGQPRNYNNRAQYGVIDLNNLNIIFESVEYDIQQEYDLYHGEIDAYYQRRLLIGE